MLDNDNLTGGGASGSNTSERLKEPKFVPPTKKTFFKTQNSTTIGMKFVKQTPIYGLPPVINTPKQIIPMNRDISPICEHQDTPSSFGEIPDKANFNIHIKEEDTYEDNVAELP